MILIARLSAEKKVTVNGKIVLELKEDINERLGRSLGCGYAIVLTFAYSTKRQYTLPAVATEYDHYS